MPNKKTSDVKEISPGNTILYTLAAIVIALMVYYLPDYFFLERMNASHSSLVLSLVGVNVQSKTIGNKVFLDGIQIVRDCTGIQVLAVFLGLLVPLPGASSKRKLVTLLVLSTILHVANVLRVAFEFWLVYFDLLPWTLAHYPLSLLLGVLGVFLLVLVADRFLPEFGNFIFTLLEAVKRKLRLLATY